MGCSGLSDADGLDAAEAAGDPGPLRQQSVLGRGQWDADAARGVVRNYTLADSDRTGH
jgi:hypothetical protein